MLCYKHNLNFFLFSRTELAKAHAKLSLRPTVTLEDAAAACRVYEMNVSDMTGNAALGVKRCQHLFDVQQDFFDEVLHYTNVDCWFLTFLTVSIQFGKS